MKNQKEQSNEPDIRMKYLETLLQALKTLDILKAEKERRASLKKNSAKD